MRKDEKRDSKYVWLGQMIAVGGEQDKHLQGLYLTSAVISRGQKHLWCNDSSQLQWGYLGDRFGHE